MKDSSHLSNRKSLKQLWREFLPLSLSDVTMAIGDPLIVFTLANLPSPKLNLAAFGIAKAIAVFFESPVIMILHASNALAGEVRSRAALWRFTLILSGALSVALLIMAFPGVFASIGPLIFDIEGELLHHTQALLALLVLWPLAIGWRRYFQGLLIRNGHSKEVAWGGISRLFTVCFVLFGGFMLRTPGHILAGAALVLGVLAEAIFVTIRAKISGVTSVQLSSETTLPSSLKGVWKFYWPLANTMLVVWGGRALLIAIIARSKDGPLALAVWPAAWGLVLVTANATRMVQQIIIRHRSILPQKLLLQFSWSVGCCFAFVLLALALTYPGNQILLAFIGGDKGLFSQVQSVVLITLIVPAFVAFQNAAQGFLIGSGKTFHINAATFASTGILLGATLLFVESGVSGSKAAAYGMSAALAVEVFILARCAFSDKYAPSLIAKGER